MYIIYNNILYELINYRGKYKITTYFKEKCDRSFDRTWDYYSKEYLETDTNIQDIFNIQFFLKWDSHFEKVDTVWEIFTDKSYLNENQVLMRFANGLLPGWRAEEQTVCSRYVDINECEDFTIVYTYTVKDGIRLETPLKQEKKVSKEEFQKTVIQFRNENI